MLSMQNNVAPKKERLFFFLGYLFVLILLNILVLQKFHNRSWVNADDGVYAHIAERLLGGERLHADIHESHGDYIHFIHAASLKNFGMKLVSLRYPAALVTFLTSLLVFFLFFRFGAVFALIAGLVPVLVGFIEIQSPTIHLCTLFLAVLCAALLMKWKEAHPLKIFLLGLLIATLFQFRPLSAVYTGSAVLIYLLLQDREATRKFSLPAGTLTALTALTLFLFTAVTAREPLGVILFALWPLVFLIRLTKNISVPEKQLITILTMLLSGFVTGFLPITGYHLYHGTLSGWFSDIYLSSFHLTALPHVGHAGFIYYFLGTLHGLMDLSKPVHVLNGFYWGLLPVLAVINGYGVWRNLKNKKLPEALPFIAVFYALVSMFNAIPFYLYATAGLSLLGIFWNALAENKHSKKAAGLCVFIMLTALYSHAGEPNTRSGVEIMEGRNMSSQPGLPEERSGLWLGEKEAETYGALISFIRTHTRPNEPLFVFPNNPEIYFLSNRKNPFAVWNTTISFRNKDEEADFFKEFSSQKPSLVIYNRDSVYNTENTPALLAFIKMRYKLESRFGEFEIYSKTEA